MTEHSSVVGGSSASRVIACTASVKLAQAAPPQLSSEYADIGTLYHAAAEKVLQGEDIEDLIGTLRYSGESGVYTLTQEGADEKVTPALEALDALANEYEVTELYEEARCKFANLEGVFGTADILMADDDDIVIVADFKFGAVSVSPVENKQLMFYAAAAAQTPEYRHLFVGKTRLVLAIIQPNFDGPPSETWETTVSSLDSFTREITAAVVEATTGNPVPQPGSHCRYCPAAPTCRASLEVVAKAIRLDINDAEHLAKAMTLVDQVSVWAETVRKQALRQLEHGVEVKGFKLVNTSPRRQWTLNDDDLAAALPEDIELFTQKVKSPNQIEKECKRLDYDFSEVTEGLITKKSSGVKVVADTTKGAPTLAVKALANALTRMKLPSTRK